MHIFVRSGVWLLLVAAGCSRLPDQPQQPRASYSADRCRGPMPAWSLQGREYGELSFRNTLHVGRGSLSWNGATISAATARLYLRTMDGYDPAVNLQVVFDERADCPFVHHIRRLVSESLHCGSKQTCVEYSKPEWETQMKRHVVN